MGLLDKLKNRFSPEPEAVVPAPRLPHLLPEIEKLKAIKNTHEYDTPLGEVVQVGPNSFQVSEGAETLKVSLNKWFNHEELLDFNDPISAGSANTFSEIELSRNDELQARFYLRQAPAGGLEILPTTHRQRLKSDLEKQILNNPALQGPILNKVQAGIGMISPSIEAERLDSPEYKRIKESMGSLDSVNDIDDVASPSHDASVDLS